MIKIIVSKLLQYPRKAVERLSDQSDANIVSLHEVKLELKLRQLRNAYGPILITKLSTSLNLNQYFERFFHQISA